MNSLLDVKEPNWNLAELRCCLDCVAGAHGDAAASDDRQLLRCAMLRLMLVWLDGCPAAVAQFLEQPAHLPLLVELASGAGGGAGERGERLGKERKEKPVRGVCGRLCGATEETDACRAS